MKLNFICFFYSKDFLYKTNLLISFFALFGSLFFQYVMNYAPCTLCLLQRFCFTSILLVALLSLYMKGKKLFFHILNFLFITSGILLSLRQVYLQRFATYDSLLCKAQELKPVYEMTLSEIFRNIYSGTSSCSEINYYFLGLSLAEWSFVIFILLLTLNIFYINKNSN